MKAVTKKLVFYDEWIDLVMKCVISISYSVLINGKPGSKVFPSRGLKQGDSLFPYLFIIYAEGLSSLLNNSDFKGNTRRVTVVREGQRVNHLILQMIAFCLGELVWMNGGDCKICC